MKRAAIFVFLLLAGAGVVWLLLQTTGAGVDRRGAAVAGDTFSEPTDADAASAEPAGDGRPGADAGAARDDDPNRIPGPDVRIVGRVLTAGGAAAPGATVAALRAEPWFEPVNYRYQRFQRYEPAVPIATTESGPGGRFELVLPRRRVVVLRATLTGHAFTHSTLFLPETGDPKEVTLHLGKGAALFGRVVAKTGEPVADAPVRLVTTNYQRPTLELETKTDAAGLFRFEDLRAGSYRVSIRREPFPLARRSVRVDGPTHVQIELVAGGAIAGRVLLADGSPLPQATLRLTTTDAVTSRQQGFAELETDAEGKYRIESILPGYVSSVVLEHRSVGRQRSSREQIDLPTKLVEPGAELQYDVRLAPGVPATGRAVLAATGAPAPGASVALLKMNSRWRGLSEVGVTKADERGHFRFPYVTEGTYALEAVSPGAARLVTRWAQAQRTITVDFYADGEASPPEQRVLLAATGTVRGTVDDVRRAGGARTSVYMQSQFGQLQAKVDDAGTFLLSNAPAMRNAVVQSHNPQHKSDPFEVVAGETVEIELGGDVDATFTGLVEDARGRPVSGARVSALPKQYLAWNLRQFLQHGWGAATTDAGGRFRVAAQEWMLKNARRGEWLLLVSHPDYALGTKKGLKLSKDGKAVETKVALSGGGTVSGRVELEGGAPAPNVVVTLTPPNWGQSDQQLMRMINSGKEPDTRRQLTARTDFDGRFEVHAVEKGVYTAHVRHPEGKSDPKQVRAGDTDLRFVVRAAHFIAGVVVDEDGRPVRNAQVAAIIPRPKGENRHVGALRAGGHFRITHLDQGSYALEVTPSKGWASGGGFVKTRIEPVATGSADVVIVVESGPAIRGRVVGTGGKPIAGAGVVAMSLEAPKKARQPNSGNNQTVRPSAVTNGRGEFEIEGVGTEEVELVALKQGFRPTTMKAVAGSGTVTLRLEVGEVIEGRILRPDGTPLARAWMNLHARSKETRDQMQDWQARGGQTFNNFGGWHMTSNQTDANGEFRFAGLLRGEYQLWVNTDGAVLPDNVLSTGAGTRVIRLESALVIRGRVVDAEGRAITLGESERIWVNARRGQRHFGGAQTDDDGSFQIEDLPAGTITLRVWAGSRGNATVNATAGDENVVIALEPPPKKKEKKPPPK